MSKKPNGKSTAAATGRKRKGKFNLAYTNRKTTKLLSESGSNELSKEDLSYLTDEEKLLLSSWDLPSIVVEKYKLKGITSLFKWQLDCLANENVLKGNNLVYSAPTSAGKTLVAEILMIKRVLELGRKAIMILPFVAVAREKMYSLQELYKESGIRVEGFMGSYNPPGGFKAVDIAICTIEKANSLINKLLEEGSLSQLGTIVVDELHLLGDPHRGYLLELLLTKVRFMTTRKPKISNPSEPPDTNDAKKFDNNLNIQIIGMSATLPNLELLAVWLKAELVITNFRPVPLVERIKIGDQICDALLTPVRPVISEALPITIPNDPDHVVYLTLETISEGHSILIFCPSKKMCEQTAEQIAREFYIIGSPTSTVAPEVGEMLRSQLDGGKISELKSQLSNCPGGLDAILGKCVAFGVAFHHAGLTYDERDIVESGFKRGVLRVIVATSTLSAGVNLPARRVIIRTPNYSSDLLDIMTYRQMSGRAGRQGIDTEGESILICSGAAQRNGVLLVQSSLPSVSSALIGIGQSSFLTSCMKRAIIEVISSGIATTPSQVNEYSKCTLLAHSIAVEEANKRAEEELSCSQHEMDAILEECLQFLINNDFIRLNKYENCAKSDEYTPTQLGCACLASSLSPDEGILVFKELEKARRCFVLENELHVIYQVTPIYLADQWRNIDWNQFLNVWQDLTLHERKVAELVGVEESFILRAMVGIVSRRNIKNASQLAVHQRFFTALALNDLVNEMPIGDVAEKYGVNKGVVQNLQQAASTFAGMVTVFCSRLGWANLELLLSQFQERLQFGVQRELCDLVRLSLLNGQRARILYDAGIKTIADLAKAEPSQVEYYLHKAGPFSSTTHGQTSRSVRMPGMREGLSEAEAARLIVQEATTFLQIELGLPENVQFNKEDKGSPEKQPTEELSNHSKSKIIHLTDRSPPEFERSKRNSGVQTCNSDDEKSTHASILVKSNEVSQSVNPSVEREASVQNWSDLSAENLFDESFNARAARNCDTTSNIKHSAEAENHNALMYEISANEQILISEMLEKSLNISETSETTPAATSVASGEPMIVVESSDSPNRSNVSIQVDVENIDEKHDVLMTSIASMMETSMHMSWNGENEVSAAELNAVNKINTYSHITTRDNFVGLDQRYSEDMFFCENELVDLNCKLLTNRPGSSSSNEILNDSSEVEGETTSAQSHPLHSTPRSSNSKKKKLQGTTVHELDEEFDKFDSSQSPQVKQFQSQRHDSFEFVRSSGKILKLKVVDDPECLPNELFSSCHSLGISLRLSCPKRSSSTPRSGIGNKIIGKRFSLSSQRPLKGDVDQSQEEDDLGISLYNDINETIWCYRWKSLNNGRTNRNGKSTLLSVNHQSKVASLFKHIRQLNIPIILIDAKQTLKTLMKYCGKYLSLENLPANIYDPRIGNWLLQSDDNKFLSLDEMVDTFLENSDRCLRTCGWKNEITNSYFSWKVMAVLKEKLLELKLWKHFTDVEMPSILPLIVMEINGLGLDHVELERVKKILEFHSTVLELRAYQIAGRQFNLSSAKDIRQVLFREIGLKQNRNAKGTSKGVLIKLDHDLPRIIIEWRKVTCALKLVVPFLLDRNFETGRVHGYYSYFTLTGRVVMSEPSLQCIPRDFFIQFGLQGSELEKLRHDCEIKFGLKFATLLARLENNYQTTVNEFENCTKFKICLRNAFVPNSLGFVMLSADYCQLELRILAHLCQDEKLIEILNLCSGDVFKKIAAQLKNTSEEMVSEEMRQEAKAITYGIIYGMGSKTLSEQLEVEEVLARRYISQFMKTYPKIRTFIDTSVAFCRENGFVETLNGRRRYLEHINSRNLIERAQAERQAVNSRVQGSASDLVKVAMNRIQSRLASLYPESLNPLQWDITRAACNKIQPFSSNVPYFPVLNLHDELIFEVNQSFLPQIAKEIKIQMELGLNLVIQIPVVVKTGPTWGKLTPFEFV